MWRRQWVAHRGIILSLNLLPGVIGSLPALVDWLSPTALCIEVAETQAVGSKSQSGTPDVRADPRGYSRDHARARAGKPPMAPLLPASVPTGHNAGCLLTKGRRMRIERTKPVEHLLPATLRTVAIASLAAFLCSHSIFADDYVLHTFERQQLTDVYYSEGASEGEALTVLRVGAGKVGVQKMAGFKADRWSGGTQNSH